MGSRLSGFAAQRGDRDQPERCPGHILRACNSDAPAAAPVAVDLLSAL